jgi:hypothetical protein
MTLKYNICVVRDENITNPDCTNRDFSDMLFKNCVLVVIGIAMSNKRNEALAALLPKVDMSFMSFLPHGGVNATADDDSRDDSSGDTSDDSSNNSTDDDGALKRC